MPAGFCGHGSAWPESWKPRSASGHLETHRAPHANIPGAGALRSEARGVKGAPESPPRCFDASGPGRRALPEPFLHCGVRPGQKGTGKPPWWMSLWMPNPKTRPPSTGTSASPVAGLGTDSSCRAISGPTPERDLRVLCLWPPVHHQGQPQGALSLTSPDEGEPQLLAELHGDMAAGRDPYALSAPVPVDESSHFRQQTCPDNSDPQCRATSESVFGD